MLLLLLLLVCLIPLGENLPMILLNLIASDIGGFRDVLEPSWTYKTCQPSFHLKASLPLSSLNHLSLHPSTHPSVPCIVIVHTGTP